jgi:acyl dehydratase
MQDKARAHVDAAAGKSSSRVGALFAVMGWIVVAALIAILSRELLNKLR